MSRPPDAPRRSTPVCTPPLGTVVGVAATGGAATGVAAAGVPAEGAGGVGTGGATVTAVTVRTSDPHVLVAGALLASPEYVAWK